MRFNDAVVVKTNRYQEDSMLVVYATTDNECQAAAIALRLIEKEGRDATTRDVADLVAEGFPIRSSFRYAVLASPVVEAECEGHPAGEFDLLGETVYCDGSCRS